MNFINRLDQCNDFSCIFELVKSAVENTIKRRRIGLSLGLLDLPNHIGAFHQMGSNFIIMNKKLLEMVIESGNKEIINSYIFHVLLHEYIHSLGYMDEQETQILTYGISEKFLGSDHPTTMIAKYGIGYIFSNITIEYHRPRSRGIEIVRDFESDNLDYFG